MLLFLIGFYIVYFILCITARKDHDNYIVVIIFILYSIILRANISFESNADFQGYVIWDNDPLELDFLKLFSEPYFYLGTNFIYHVTSSSIISLKIFYIVNLLGCTYFFIWLASKTDVVIWKKMVLFSMFYFLFSYTTIRNTPAYVLVCFLFYAIQRNAKYIPGYLSFIAHTSSLPVIAATLLKVKKPSYLSILLILVFCIAIYFGMQLSLFKYMTEKFDAYSSGQGEVGQGIFHKIHFSAVLLLSFFLFIKNRAYVYNNCYMCMFFLYIFLFALSPVMAFRFSVYIALFLGIFPVLKYNNIIDKVLNRLSLLFVFYFIYSFYSTHPS